MKFIYNYDSALYNACKLGYSEFIDEFLEKGANFESGLGGAAEGGHIDIIDLILEKVVPKKVLEQIQILKEFFVEQFKEHDDLKLKICEKNTKDPNDPDMPQSVLENILTGLCKGGHKELILKFESKYNLYKNIYWDEILKFSCEGGNKEIVELIIEKGKDAGHEFDWNQGLYGACLGGHINIIDLIIEKGKDTGHKFYWNDGLYGACKGGHKDIVDLMISKGENIFDIYNTCYGGNKEIVEFMIKNGNEDEFDWDDGLQGACEGGHMEIVKLMIEKGANNWNKGLICACVGGNKEIINLLIEKGAVYNGTPVTYKFNNRIGKSANIIA